MCDKSNLRIDHKAKLIFSPIKSSVNPVENFTFNSFLTVLHHTHTMSEEVVEQPQVADEEVDVVSCNSGFAPQVDQIAVLPSS